MNATVRSCWLVLSMLVVASGCGDSAEPTTSGPVADEAVTTTITEPASPPTTVAPSTTPPSTTSTTAATTTTTTTSTTTTTTPTTTTTAPAPDLHALGTVQIVFVPYGDGAVLPQPPVGGSVRIEGAGTSLTVPFEDPDPGFVSNDDGTLSITIRTFAASLAPGTYQIDSIELIDDALGDPVNVALFPPFMPRFTVLADADCTLLGNMTLLWWRLAPGDMGVELANEIGAEQGLSLVFLESGPLAYGDAGMDILADLIETDLSGKSWWQDGTEIDAANCVANPAEF